MKVSDKPLDKTGQKVLIYGPPKTGKTLLAGMVAAQYNILWFDLEHGALTLKQLPLEYQQRIELIQVPDDKSNFQAMTTMLYASDGKPIKVCDLHGGVNLCKRCALANVSGNTNDIGTMVSIDIERLDPAKWVVVVDSLTQISHSSMGKTLGGLGIEEVVKPNYDNYMGQGYYLDRFLTAVQNSRMNWIVISHESELELEDGTSKIVPMAGTRNFSKSASRYFDHVVRASIHNRKYSASSNGLDDTGVLVGSRTDISLRGIPAADALINLLRGVKPAAQAAAPAARTVASLQGGAADAPGTPPLTPAQLALQRARAAKNPGATPDTTKA